MHRPACFFGKGQRIAACKKARGADVCKYVAEIHPVRFCVRLSADDNQDESRRKCVFAFVSVAYY